MQRLYHKMRPNRYGDCYTNQGIDPSTSRQLSLSKFRVKRFEFFFYVANEDGEGSLS